MKQRGVRGASAQDGDCRMEPGEGVPSGPHPGLQGLLPCGPWARARQGRCAHDSGHRACHPRAPPTTTRPQDGAPVSHRHPGHSASSRSRDPRAPQRGVSLHEPHGVLLPGAHPDGASPWREGQELFFFFFVPQTKRLLILNVLILSILLAKGEEITGMSLLATPDLRKPPEARWGLPGVLVLQVCRVGPG